MAIGLGSRLGPYEVTALLGEGGMGKVWRAHHTALRRDDAVKVLPDGFASDPDRVSRFRREAQVLASLNHPNIAHVYGLEQLEEVQALVMELVEGPTLADRIARGPIALDEALPIAKQIAEAIEAAHEQGIIHRDLKPANIKVRSDGMVKVLDFGLAKALGPAEVRDATASPTITSPALMTGAGVLLGTAAYMSPEQARGKAVDKRTDIWAFGCILYEMLAGRRAFGGEEVADTLAFVLSREPDWLALPATTPVSIRKLLRRCLEKDRRRRLADIADARFELDDAPSDDPPLLAPPVAQRTLRRVAIAWFAAGMCLTAALGLAAAMYLRPEPVEAPTMRFAVSPPDGWSLASGTRLGGVATSPLAVSPDGRLIAMLARNAEGRDRLWVRGFDTLAARELPGTDGAMSPFWSPDSAWIGFFAEGRLKKIAVAGGTPITLCDTPTFNSASWGRDGTIIFALGPGTGIRPIRRVSASGGVATDATVVVDGENNHIRPAFLSDGRHFFFRVQGGPNGGYYLTALDSNERTRMFGNDVANVVFAGDHVLFLRDTTLVAQSFDVRQLRLAGDAMPVAEQIARFGGGAGVGIFSASNAVLAYQTGVAGGASRLTWFARDGMPIEAISDRADYSDLSLSPDGSRALVSIGLANTAGDPRHIWLVDLDRGLRTRFTFDASNARQSVWSPDGRRVIFESLRKGARDLYQKNSNLSGVEEVLLADSFDKRPLSVSPDGRLLLYSAGQVGRPPDIWILPLSGDRQPRPFLETPFAEFDGSFSPDGRWIAYTSQESGRNEVYVAPFPGPGGKRQISGAGGSAPRWRRDGREIFYIDADERLTAVAVDGRGEGFEIGVAQPLFTISRRDPFGRVYDVSPDGQRILASTAEEQTSAPITVVVNWQSALGTRGAR